MTEATGRRIAIAALLIAVGNILSRVLGIVREPVIAALFGVSGTTDAWEVATRIPQSIHELVIGGMVSGALIPVLSELADDDQALRRTFSTVFAAVVAVAGIATVVLVLLAEPLVDLAAIGLPPETRELAVTMTRITLPSLLFLGISSVTTARLFARDRYAFPAFSTASLNGTFIVFALALTPIVGPPGVALGYLAGAAMHLLIQLPALVRDRARLSPPAWLSDARFHQILRLYAPIAGGLMVTLILVMVDANLASRTGEGGLATMRFATRLQQFPLGLVATAISLAYLPTLARAAPASIRDLASATDFRRHLGMAAKVSTLLIIPITVLMTTLSAPITRIVYERGDFTPAATDAVGPALLLYAIQLPLTALDQIFIVAFYAMRNTITPGRGGHCRRGCVFGDRALAGRAAWRARSRDRQHRAEQLSRPGPGSGTLVAHARLGPACQLVVRVEGRCRRRRHGAGCGGAARGRRWRPRARRPRRLVDPAARRWRRVRDLWRGTDSASRRRAKDAAVPPP